MADNSSGGRVVPFMAARVAAPASIEAHATAWAEILPDQLMDEIAGDATPGDARQRLAEHQAVRKYLAGRSIGISPAGSCALAGAKYATLRRWRQSEAFRELELDCEEMAADFLEDRAWSIAVNGLPGSGNAKGAPPSADLLVKLLAARRPEKYGAQKNVRVSGVVDVKDPSTEMVQAIKERAAKRLQNEIIDSEQGE
ncbi:MAG: hypothetical protein VYB54_15705 [Pseudomonadota bacterium]|nr:hypothetical protein [Pseudomonadota bacterium]